VLAPEWHAKRRKAVDEKQLNAARSVRRHLVDTQPAQGMKKLLEALAKHKTNQSLYDSMKV
jgi:transcription termination factor Rho